jgi:solute carrier family 13 (sodium-dependent dicarboxylate transporter), member 2/3/5
MAKKIDVLIVDDEQKFRENMSKRLELRGYKVHHVGNGEDAIRQVRQYDVDVVLLDLKMPGMSGEQTLRELRAICPVCQVIIVTGHGSYESATVTGKFDAFSYLEKTTDFDDLMAEIEAAKRNKLNALIREERIPEARPTFKQKMMGVTNYRPIFIIIGFLLFLGVLVIPTPKSLIDVVSLTKNGEIGEKISGYAYYRKMADNQSVADFYGKYAEFLKGNGDKKYPVEYAAFKAKIMIALLVLAAFFWGTGAIPIGFTAILVGVVMYWFQIMPPAMVAKAFMKDSVIFIFGVLAMSVGIARTGLDRRIGALLLGIATDLKRFLFFFCPLLAVTASFISEHALVAFIAPIMVTVYMASIRRAGIEEDKNLAITLILIITFVGNIGGPGSPSAGGRNAIMLGILKDYGNAPSYGEWMMYGLPFVPVMALVIGLYFYIVLYRKIKLKDINISKIVKDESEKLGRMLPKEYMMAGILFLVILGWIFMSDTYGMGGPVLAGLVMMSVLRVVRWQDITHISWDVVALYSAATAMGVGLAVTGAALWIAGGFIDMLPETMRTGTGLAVTCSLLTGILTNLMSDGATVSVIGPLTTPMAVLSGTHPWMTGFATAFSSSFAHAMIVGTPNNAIVYAIAVNPLTGKRLITLGDFIKHGGVLFIISLLVLWLWAFFGYWQWIGFPEI